MQIQCSQSSTVQTFKQTMQIFPDVEENLLFMHKIIYTSCNSGRRNQQFGLEILVATKSRMKVIFLNCCHGLEYIFMQIKICIFLCKIETYFKQ